MGRPGSALDNAVIESWHSTVEFELRRLERFATKAEARTKVAAWIEEYNHDRRHSALDMLSPIAYERRHATPDRRPAGAGSMTGRPSAATQRGTVLAAVKATPCGWPPASLDPDSGRVPQPTSGRGKPKQQISSLYGSLEKNPQATCSRVTRYPRACSCSARRAALRRGSIAWVSR